MKQRRFRVPPGSLPSPDLARRDTLLRLAPTEARHVRVLRLRPGAEVELFDGAGTTASGTLHAVTDAEVVVRIDASATVGGVGSPEAVGTTGASRGAPAGRAASTPDAAAESPVSVTLVQAIPAKLQRLDATVRLCTELGLTMFIPVVATRTQIPGGGLAVLDRRVERWRRIAEAAAKQCGRSVVPVIAAVTPFDQMVWEDLSTPCWVLHAAGGITLSAALTGDPEPGCTLLVGPEGGWTEAERERAAAAGARAVSLGPRVLRADSAGVAALALVQAAWGDLRATPRAPDPDQR